LAVFGAFLGAGPEAFRFPEPVAGRLDFLEDLLFFT